MRSILGRVGVLAAASVLAAGVLASPAHAELGSLSGTITAADTGAALAGCVAVYEAGSEEWVHSTCSAEDGRWTVGQLPVGTNYKVRAVMNDGRHIEEWAHNARTFEDATAFTVPATVDVALDLGAVIEGRLLEANGGTASFADVLVFEEGGSPAATAYATPDWDGRWATLVPAGSYKVRFSSDFYIQWAFQKDTRAHAEVITVGPGDHAQVDDQFMPLAIVAGTITSELTGHPIAGACLQFFAAHDRNMDESSTEACTDQTGSYLIPLPGAGDYFAIIDHRWGDFAGEFSGDTRRVADAEVLTVARGETLRFDASLAQGAILTGRVVDAKTRAPVSGICVDAHQGRAGSWDRWQKVECSGADGRWRVRGLGADSYALFFSRGEDSLTDHLPKWAYNADSQARATLFPVVAGQTKSLRDVKLVSGCPTKPTGRRPCRS